MNFERAAYQLKNRPRFAIIPAATGTDARSPSCSRGRVVITRQARSSAEELLFALSRRLPYIFEWNQYIRRSHRCSTTVIRILFKFTKIDPSRVEDCGVGIITSIPSASAFVQVVDISHYEGVRGCFCGRPLPLPPSLAMTTGVCGCSC
jgi:hypothetical protein